MYRHFLFMKYYFKLLYHIIMKKVYTNVKNIFEKSELIMKNLYKKFFSLYNH
jgi:hypothetical protein